MGREWSVTRKMKETFWKDRPPCSPLHLAFMSELLCWRALAFLDISPSPIKRIKKNTARTSMLLQGNTTHTHIHTVPPLSPLLLLLLFYSITVHQYLPLHLLSSPEPFGRCVSARHEWRGERLTDQRNYKIKALSVSQRLDAADTAAPGRGSVVIFLPALYLIYGAPVDVPCILYVFVVFDWFRNSAVLAVDYDRNKGMSFFIYVFFFLFFFCTVSGADEDLPTLLNL